MSTSLSFNDSLFSKSQHKKLHQNVEKDYTDFIEDVREDLKKGFVTDVVDPQFLDQLNDIIHDVVFDHYSPLKFYWMNLVDNLIYLIQLHEEILSSEDYNSTNENLTAAEEELFGLWNDSELAKMFLDILNEGLPVIEVSDQLVPLLENQIISFYVLHINQFQQEFDDAIIYQAIREIGDYENRIYFSDDHKFIDLQNVPEGFPSIALKSFKPQKDEVVLEIKEDDLTFKTKSATPSIQVDGVKIFITPNCQEGQKNIKKFQANIELALKRIKVAAPQLFEVFTSFTHTIVPVNEEGIVSYSMQSLPGYSSINLFERDQIDLMDDLLHENGHHYLNTYLNHLDLINEDDDKIYYSPWRKALRPIRGIYHATFTFYWALELFHGLIKSIENKKLKFTSEETLKIHLRFVEEYYMLDYCFKDLEHAFKNKKINKNGYELITSIFKRIKNYKTEIVRIEENLKKESSMRYKQIVELKEQLSKARIQYKL
jgi:hypothetical protein